LRRPYLKSLWQRHPQKGCLLGLLPFVALFCFASFVEAAVFTVTKTADTNDGGCDPGDCSLREAIIAANASPGADTLTFLSPAAVYSLSILPSGGNETTSGDLNIYDDLSIVGNGEGATIVDGNDIDRIFSVASGVSVSVTGLTVRNGLVTATNAGGGIYNSGALTLTQVTVELNRACNGGGLSNSGTAALDSVTISQNLAFSGGACATSGTGFGGGVFNLSSGILDLTNSSIRNNSAEFNGGGIYSSSGQVTITGGELRENSGGAYGGAADSMGVMTLSGGTTVNDNTANDGGGISNRESNAVLTISGVTFSGNVANGDDLGGGGAIFSYQSEAYISNTTFSANEAYGEGGGAIESTGTLMLSNNTFSNNRAIYHFPNALPETTSPGFGGALLLISGGDASLAYSFFTGNDAAVNGGAIYNDRGSTLSIFKSTVDTNSVTAENCGSGCRGGGILNEGDLWLFESTVSSNDAPLQGGGISHAVGKLNLINSTLRNNIADNGGGLYSLGTTVVKNSSVIDNTALTDFGGGIQNDADLTVVNTTISGNSAGVGGGLSNSGGGSIRLFDSTIVENTASISASAVYNWKGMVTLSNTVLQGRCNNWHLNSGGVGDENPSSPVSNGGNLESPGNTCQLTAGTDQVNVADPMLAPIDDNGGPTWTHSPLAGSPVIDQGVDAVCTPRDQRLAARPFDGDGDLTATCDIGAVEFAADPPGDYILLLVVRYYNDILGRAPEPGGAEWWQSQIERLVSLGVDTEEGFRAIAKLFFNSQEYLSKGKTGGEYVEDLYQTFFTRTPSSSERDYWVNRMSQGVSRNTVMNFFSFSVEFRNYLEGVFGPCLSRPEYFLVNDFYRGFLTRLPDDGGFNYWMEQIQTAQCAGDGPAIQDLAYQIASLFVSLPEYLNKNRDSAGFVEDLYDAIMRRDGDSGGINYWVNTLETESKTRNEVMFEFTKSSEFQQRVDDVISAACFVGP